MNNPSEIAVLVGSLRQGSYSRMLAHAATELAPRELRLHIVEIGDIAFYNEDLEATPPAAWTRLREQVQHASGALLITPEYNRSVPAVLKNAVDVLSRPWGKSVLAEMPVAVISSSPGALGGFGANHHLRQALLGAGAHAMGTPEAYISSVGNLVNEGGALTDRATRDFLAAFLQAFARWVRTNAKA